MEYSLFEVNSWKSPTEFLKKVHQDIIVFPILLLGNIFTIYILFHRKDPTISGMTSTLFLSLFLIILVILLTVYPIKIFYDIQYAQLIKPTRYREFNMEDHICSKLITAKISDFSSEIRNELWLNSPIKRSIKKLIPIYEIIWLIDKDMYIVIGSTYIDFDNLRKTTVYIGPNDKKNSKSGLLLQNAIDKSVEYTGYE